MVTRFLLVDVNGIGRGKRLATLDVIGAGARSIAGVLEKKGLSVELVSFEDLLKNPASTQNYDVLLVSAMTVDLTAARKVRNLWSKVAGNKISVIGGSIACDPNDALLKAGYDICVIGEGEETLEDLLKFLQDEGSSTHLKEVEGIAYKHMGRISYNHTRPLMPRQKYDSYTPSTRIIKYYPIYFACRVYVEVLRGCSNFYRTSLKLPDKKQCIHCYKCRTGPLRDRLDCPFDIPPGCGYCSVPTVFGPPRSRSIGKIVKEINALIDEGVRRIVLSAPDILDYGRDLLTNEPLTDPKNPPPSLDALEKLFSSIFDIDAVKKRSVSIGIENVKANLVTEETAELLGRFFKGSPVHIGCESGSNEHCTALGRPSTPNEVLIAVRRLRKNGLRPYVYFIHGLPGQDKDSAIKSITLMRKLSKSGLEKITVYRFQPLPMSAFANMSHPPPATHDKLSNMIVKEAKRINKTLKFKIVGSTVRAIIAGRYHKNPSLLIGYPLMHGPVILVKGNSNLIGKLCNIRIMRVISDRLVEGENLDFT